MNNNELTDDDWARFYELVEKLKNRKTNKLKEDFQKEIKDALQNENEMVKRQVKEFFRYLDDPDRRYERQILNDRYLIDKKIGSGASGIVYEAIDLKIKRRRVAIKIIYPGLALSKKKDLFVEEAKTYAQLIYITHVSPIIEVEFFDDPITRQQIPFCVMFLHKGANPITTYIKEKKLPERNRLNLFLKICEAVQGIHSENFFHGDLKPSNIIVDGKGGVLIIDFGLAYVLNKLKSKSHFGTPGYMAPEQALNGYGKPGKHSDTYTLGVILFEFITGKKLYDLLYEKIIKNRKYESIEAVRQPLKRVLLVPYIVVTKHILSIYRMAVRLFGGCRTALIQNDLPDDFFVVSQHYEEIINDSKYYEIINEGIRNTTDKNIKAIDKKYRVKLGKIITKALQKKPSNRYKSVKDLKNTIEKVFEFLNPNYDFMRSTSIEVPKRIIIFLGISVLIGNMFTLLYGAKLGTLIEPWYYFIQILLIFVVIGSVSSLTFKYFRPIRSVFNSTLLFSYIVGVCASIIGGLLYGFGPLSRTEWVTEIQHMWNIRFLRFMIPGLILPFLYASIFAISSAKRKEKSLKKNAVSVIAWLFLVVVLGSTILISMHLTEYAAKYSGISLFLGDKNQGDVRCEIFILVTFLSVLSVVNFENWKLVRNTKNVSSFSISGASFLSRSITFLVFFLFSGCILAITFWGSGMTPKPNDVSFAIILISLITGWGISSFYLFTGENALVKWIDQNFIAKKAKNWSSSLKIEEAREKFKDKWFSK